MISLLMNLNIQFNLVSLQIVNTNIQPHELINPITLSWAGFQILYHYNILNQLDIKY